MNARSDSCRAAYGDTDRAAQSLITFRTKKGESSYIQKESIEISPRPLTEPRKQFFFISNQLSSLNVLGCLHLKLPTSPRAASERNIR